MNLHSVYELRLRRKLVWAAKILALPRRAGHRLDFGDNSELVSSPWDLASALPTGKIPRRRAIARGRASLANPSQADRFQVERQPAHLRASACARFASAGIVRKSGCFRCPNLSKPGARLPPVPPKVPTVVVVAD